jgi:hypothetical protein
MYPSTPSVIISGMAAISVDRIGRPQDSAYNANADKVLPAECVISNQITSQITNGVAFEDFNAGNNKQSAQL